MDSGGGPNHLWGPQTAWQPLGRDLQASSWTVIGYCNLCSHCISPFRVLVMNQINAQLILSPTGPTTPSRTTGTPPWGGRWSMRGTCRTAARISLPLMLEWRDATTDHHSVLQPQQSPSTVIAVPCQYQALSRSTSPLDFKQCIVLISYFFSLLIF